MLNISNSNSVFKELRKLNLSALNEVESKVSGKVFLRIIIAALIVFFVVSLLPWTQNIQSYGKVITLHPEQRPQTIHSAIAGRVDKWYVKEGDQVKKGDTIVYLTEIKDTYLDPNLLENTAQQKDLKYQSISTYEAKVTALQNQIENLIQESQLKTQQAKIKLQQAGLKVQSDSINYQAAAFNLKTFTDQYDRFEGLEEEGLASKTELENRNMKYQEAQSYEIAAKNKLLASKSDYINAQVDLNAVKTKYQNDIAKAQSDKASAESMLLEAKIALNKLTNQYANYEIRNDMYYVLAPQDGYVTQAVSNGLGETIKEGDPIISIMPDKYDYAVEMYVDPIDLPLIHEGQHVRIQFDGWPAIVFSGWPNTSYGTYGGQVYAIDKFIGMNGKYRVLIAPEIDDHPWPTALRFGSGTRNMIMLQDVPVWYEIWRQINGFPPDFYQAEQEAVNAKKK